MLPLPWCRVTEGKVGPDKVSSEEFLKKSALPNTLN